MEEREGRPPACACSLASTRGGRRTLSSLSHSRAARRTAVLRPVRAPHSNHSQRSSKNPDFQDKKKIMTGLGSEARKPKIPARKTWPLKLGHSQIIIATTKNSKFLTIVELPHGKSLFYATNRLSHKFIN